MKIIDTQNKHYISLVRLVDLIFHKISVSPLLFGKQHFVSVHACVREKGVSLRSSFFSAVESIFYHSRPTNRRLIFTQAECS